MKYLLILLLFVACTREIKKPTSVELPQGSMFVINEPPRPTAYKKDSVSGWVVMDSAATLKVLLNMVEQQYKRSQEIQKK